MKKLFSVLCMTLLSFVALAQETVTETKSIGDDLLNDPLLPLYIVSLFVLIVILLVVLVAIYLWKILNMLANQAEEENARKLGITYAPKQNWWKKFIDQINAAVPVEKEKAIVLDHNYDGIRELDNHLPPWWTWLFIGSIAWSAVYMVIYHISDTFPLQLDEYQQELVVADEQARTLKASQPQETLDENILAFADDKAIIEKGKSVFISYNCASCHQAEGGGNAIGPNLTDEYWINGGSIKNIFTTIKNGVVEKGMPAWGKSMSPQDVKAAAFFVMSLKGTNPVGAKAAQGELYKEEMLKSDSILMKADSTRVRVSL